MRWGLSSYKSNVTSFPKTRSSITVLPLRIWEPIGLYAGLPGWLVVKNPPGNAGDIRDVGLIPGSERSPGGGHGNPLQYSCLENAWTEELGGLQAIALQRVGLKQFSTQAREIILDNLGGPDWISW